jgi:hypothetical protein
MAVTAAGWLAMLNNFAIEKAAFSGAEIGMLHSLREVPGFLAFTAVFLLLVMCEQTLALISLCVMTVGIAITGYFPTEYGLYATTVLMSIGYHYYETVNTSLSLQWFSKEEAPTQLGHIMSIRSLASLIGYGFIWLLFTFAMLNYNTIYVLFGCFGVMLFLFMWWYFPKFESPVLQHKKLILKKRYWLYYLLTFFSGARRQIFIVFAGFMMVEKFGYSPSEIALLYILNELMNWYLAPKIGAWIGRVGEQNALTFEYIGLVLVFVSYALVESSTIAAGLYLVDHVLFAMAIAVKTFFQKIADPADIAGSAGVSFSINHIAAVIIPAAFGIVWLINPAAVFYMGAGLAVLSLILAQFVNRELVRNMAPMQSQIA